LWWPKRGDGARERLEDLDLHAVLVTWSSPRITWVIAGSMSSATEGSV
jgi:hypothetical protein